MHQRGTIRYLRIGFVGRFIYVRRFGVLEALRRKYKRMGLSRQWLIRSANYSVRTSTSTTVRTFYSIERCVQRKTRLDFKSWTITTAILIRVNRLWLAGTSYVLVV
jgi:hypothetical protein